MLFLIDLGSWILEHLIGVLITVAIVAIVGFWISIYTPAMVADRQQKMDLWISADMKLNPMLTAEESKVRYELMMEGVQAQQSSDALAALALGIAVTK